MNLTNDSTVFLSALDTLGGMATTPELRMESGLGKNKIHYQYTKLHKLGYIDISYADSGVGNRHPPKIATITSPGIEALEEQVRELAEKEDVIPNLEPDEMVLKRSDFFELKEANEELQRRLNALEEQQSALARSDQAVSETLERRYEYLEKLNTRVLTLSEWRNTVNQYLLACEFAFNTINFDFDKAMDVVSDDFDLEDQRLQNQ